MPAHIERDTTLIVVLSHDGREVERAVCTSPDAAVAAAIRMLCKRGDDLTGGDCLRVLSPPDDFNRVFRQRRPSWCRFVFWGFSKRQMWPSILT